MSTSGARPVSAGLFRDHGDGTARLLGGRCGACGCCHFPAAVVCPYCSVERIAPVELGPRGSLWLYTSVLRRPPGYLGDVPFGFGIVALEPGVRVVGRLTEADPSELVAGQAMLVVVDHLHTGDDGGEVLTYAFAPEAGR